MSAAVLLLLAAHRGQGRTEAARRLRALVAQEHGHARRVGLRADHSGRYRVTMLAGSERRDLGTFAAILDRNEEARLAEPTALTNPSKRMCRLRSELGGDPHGSDRTLGQE
jgi:hypothetical protein